MNSIRSAMMVANTLLQRRIRDSGCMELYAPPISEVRKNSCRTSSSSAILFEQSLSPERRPALRGGRLPLAPLLDDGSPMTSSLHSGPPSTNQELAAFEITRDHRRLRSTIEKSGVRVTAGRTRETLTRYRIRLRSWSRSCPSAGGPGSSFRSRRPGSATRCGGLQRKYRQPAQDGVTRLERVRPPRRRRPPAGRSSPATAPSLPTCSPLAG